MVEQFPFKEWVGGSSPPGLTKFMHNLSKFYKNKKVLVTGASGFKGSWLCSCLLKLGAKVYGIGYSPNKNRNLFYSLSLEKKVKFKLIDIRNFSKMSKYINSIKPSIIFHLAAQPIVHESYKNPFETFETNSKGTLNILEIVRKSNFTKSIVLATSDKCYENLGYVKRYSETDRLGGVDPYSASKASAEIIIKAYSESFFKDKKKCGISSARAGNVIGGGDWSPNRLFPDCIRSITKKKKIILRNPNSNRPWQFILDPLMGYLILAKKQYENPKRYSSSYNFGPEIQSITSVKDVVSMLVSFWGSGSYVIKKNSNFVEHNNLQLNANKSKKTLKWKPIYNTKQSVRYTTEWYYKTLKKNYIASDITNYQITQHMNYTNWK